MKGAKIETKKRKKSPSLRKASPTRKSKKPNQKGGDSDTFVKNQGDYFCIKSQSIKDLMNALQDLMIRR
jgi:hypothetical protein